jgi:N utilization substance protein B
LTGNTDVDPIQAKKLMMQKVDKIYDLYVFYLLVFTELVEKGEDRIEGNKEKMRPSDQDLAPNMKFVNNRMVKKLSESNELRKISEDRKVNWDSDEQKEMMRKLYYVVMDTDIYQDFMMSSEDSFEADKRFTLDLFKDLVANHEPILNFFEEKSVDWLDDIDQVCKGILKTFNGMKEGEELNLISLHKDDKEDKDFVATLFKTTVQENDENLALIDSLTSNWEVERIAKMDLILMSLAISELKEFKSIPKKVTLNEYIEISKFYSTPKSSTFINGILDKAITKLEKDGSIKKMGRGLIN